MRLISSVVVRGFAVGLIFGSNSVPSTAPPWLKFQEDWRDLVRVLLVLATGVAIWEFSISSARRWYGG